MAESVVPSELEAKLLVPHERALRAMAQLTALGPYRLCPRDVVRVHSVYLDTADFALARHAVVLRLRRVAARWEATLKWEGRVVGDIHERPELTVALGLPPQWPFVPPPGPLHVRLAAVLAGRPLQPILVTEIHRRLVDVRAADAADEAPALAEVALDRVHLRGPDGAPPPTAPHDSSYLEVEIERLHGTRQDVTHLARLLRDQFALLPSPESKFARGVALLYGGGFPGVAAPATVRGDATVAHALRIIVARHLRRLRDCDPGVRLGEDPEALHNMRVATRRLRAALRAFGDALPVRQERALTAELKWLGEVLGSVRDLDVQLANLQRFAGAAPPGHRNALAPYREYMQSERDRQRVAMLTALDSKRYNRLLLRLEDLALGARRQRGGAAAGQRIARAGHAVIRKAFRRLLARGDRIRAAPAPEDLHMLRIRAKRLRYALEFLRDISGKPGQRLIKRLVRLQDLLGAHHDAVVAADFVRHYVEGPGVQVKPPTMLALGALVGRDLRLAEDALTQFDEAWHRFTRKRTLRERDALLERLEDLATSATAPSPARATPP